MSDLPPAGWYADPNDGAQQRYWDGEAWTEHVAPATTGPDDAVGTTSGDGTTGAAVAATSDTDGWPQGTAQGSTVFAGAAAGDVDSWTWQSIVATILCCNLVGVVGVLNAGRAEAALRVGNVADARRYADSAKKWTLWAAGLTLGLYALGAIFFFVAAAAGSANFQ